MASGAVTTALKKPVQKVPSKGKELTAWTVISRLILFVCLLLLILFGYRLMVVRAIDRVYLCVEEKIDAVEAVSALIDNQEGLLVEESSVVLEKAQSAGEELSSGKDCFSDSSGWGNEGLIQTCSAVASSARSYVGRIEEAALVVTEGDDAFELQNGILEAYALYKQDVSDCDSAMEEALSRASFDL